METTAVKKERVWFMYYYHEGKLVRSREYPSLREFVAKCGKWCDEHPDEFYLHSRVRTVDVM